jgi:hypothetical protein
LASHDATDPIAAEKGTPDFGIGRQDESEHECPTTAIAQPT